MYRVKYKKKGKKEKGEEGSRGRREAVRESKSGIEGGLPGRRRSPLLGDLA